MIVLQNPEYPDADQTKYNFFIVFYSKSNTPVVSIKTITLSINGVKVEYGKKMINGAPSDWRLPSVNKAYYVSSIYAEPIDRPEEEMVKARVDVSLEVSVKDESGRVIEKKIDVNFLPKKLIFFFTN